MKITEKVYKVHQFCHEGVSFEIEPNPKGKNIFIKLGYTDDDSWACTMCLGQKSITELIKILEANKGYIK